MSRVAGTGLALVMVALAVGMGVFASAPAKAANVPLSLFGSATNGWGTSSTSETNPGPTFTVNQGDTVTITLTSTDGFPHEFLIDYNGNGVADPGEPVSASFTSTATVTFVASQVGTYHYLCLVHPTIMKGTFVVQAAGSPTPANAPSDSGSALLRAEPGLLIPINSKRPLR